MADTTTDARPLTEADLVAWFDEGSKPASQFLVGAEHEKFVFRLRDHATVPYEGDAGILALLTGLMRFGWAPVKEGETIIGLSRGMANVSLEPGGQFELSGAPLPDMHAICDETGKHLEEVKAVADELGLGFLGLGFAPTWRREDIPRMPKGRYRIMREYMPKVGNLGLDMMFRTCTVQANLDFASEADMVLKFRTSLALQPIATALFANSPFIEGKPSGFLSARANVWTDTDADRTGMLDFVFEDGFGYQRYVDYLLDVPMYFSYRDGIYHDASGKSFRKFLRGELDVLPGALPTLRDWNDHMTTAFPEVRLKKFLEMRGADGGPWNRLCALPAFWVGLLYDDAALDAAWDLVRDFSMVERHALRDGVPKQALKLPFRGGTVRDIAIEALKISRAGLQRRARADACGIDESGFLDPLLEIAESGETPAERKLALFHGEWSGSVDPVFREFAY